MTVGSKQWGVVLTAGIVVLAAAAVPVPVATAQGCCECRNCPAGVSACSAEEGIDRRRYEEETCTPLGCLTATCLARDCDRGSNRCPAAEVGQCADRVDNDADGLADCDDEDCSAEPQCVAGGGDGGGSTCCTGRDDLPGCDDRACEACVCAADEFCCTAVWDVNCAARARGTCADLCPCEGEAPPSDTPTPPAPPDGARTPSPAAMATPTPPDGARTPSPAGTATPPPRCRVDTDCPAGATCRSGRCVEAAATPGGKNGADGGGCTVGGGAERAAADPSGWMALLVAAGVLAAARGNRKAWRRRPGT